MILYHVIWRPCCHNPVQGGIQQKVFAVPKDNPQYLIIASNETEAQERFESL